MSGKVGELIPTYKKHIQPSAPPSPSPPASRFWVARTPSRAGVEAMQRCQDIVARMRAEGRAEREKRSGGKSLKPTLVGLDGTWFIWQFLDASAVEEPQQRG